MTISFDLDDTLIPSTKTFPTEPRTLLLRILNLEPLRRGTPDLMRQLIAQGHRIAIYTTSHRSATRIRWTFSLHGIPLHTIINAQIHRKTLGDSANISSKYPPAFGIDLHIDDSPGLAIEGQRHGFTVHIIHPHDPNWTKSIESAIQSLTTPRIP